MDEAATPEAQRKIVEIGRLPGDESLSDHLAAGTLVRLRDYLDSLGRPRRSFDRFKPGMIVFMIGSIEAMRLGARVEHGLEEHFHRRCMEDGKPTRALETLEYQLTLFDALPPEELDRMLLDALAEAGKNGESFVRLIGAWKSGDADRLGRLMDREMPLDSPQRDILLGRRNANWIPEIEAALEEEGTTLFLVGAAHLVGEDSVVSLLRKRGWQLERVTSSDPARKTRTQDMQAPAPAP